jgi:hypothetical protein
MHRSRYHSLYVTQLSRFHSKTEIESSLRNVVFLNKNRMMDNVQKHNIYTIIQILDLIVCLRSQPTEKCQYYTNFVDHCY